MHVGTEKGVAAFEQVRPTLFGLAYRMLGSRMDAEDIVQEAYVRWQQTDQTHVRSPRSFLLTIVTRLSIDALRLARRSRETYVGEWLPEPLAGDDSRPDATADLAESLSMAFLVLLETLTPAERAAFLLREIFGVPYDELASVLVKSEANCRQLVKRARDRIDSRRPRFRADPDETRDLIQRFVDATTAGDVEGLVACLAEDAELHTDHGGKAIAARRVIFGADKISRFFVGVVKRFAPPDASHRMTTLNGQPALVTYSADRADSALFMDVADGRIRTLYVVRNPDKLKTLV